ENIKTELKSFMMEGFTAMDQKIEFVYDELSAKIDGLVATKTDREEVFAIHKRVVRLERKMSA
ncbi:MAG: hypothetical protein KGI79_03410, partial [Patescibacteria group bacterium]|nr:hypothetical protein [Patescibacteria group bacterium]